MKLPGKKADRQALSLQMAVERVLNLHEMVERMAGLPKENREEIRRHLSWIGGELRSARSGDDPHQHTGGLSCGCHDDSPMVRDPPRKDCPRCHGTGTIPMKEIRARARGAK